MREIKLRAWDSEANIMVYSDHRTIKLYDVYSGITVTASADNIANIGMKEVAE